MCFVLQSKKPFLLAQGGDPLLLASTTRTTTSTSKQVRPYCKERDGAHRERPIFFCSLHQNRGVHLRRHHSIGDDAKANGSHVCAWAH